MHIYPFTVIYLDIYIYISLDIYIYHLYIWIYPFTDKYIPSLFSPLLIGYIPVLN